MKNKLPLILIMLTVLSVALAVGYTVYERSQSSPGMPQISFDKSSIEAGVDASDEELLRGVTASDPEDGDITVRFTDYRQPIFSFTRGMEFKLSGNIDILKYIEAQDMFDGDISDKVKYSIDSDALSLSSVGEHQVTLRVTNSLGDTSHLTITVEVTADDPNAADISLKQYVVYLPAGAEFDAASYVTGYTANGEQKTGADGLRIENKVDTDTPGVYNVKYSYGYGSSESHVRLTVVVEQGGA